MYKLVWSSNESGGSDFCFWYKKIHKRKEFFNKKRFYLDKSNRLLPNSLNIKFLNALVGSWLKGKFYLNLTKIYELTF